MPTMEITTSQPALEVVCNGQTVELVGQGATLELSAGGTGAQGPAGADGADGADGVGVPAGGTSGQVLAKSTAEDYETEWVDQTGGGGGGVESVNGQTGVVVLDADDIDDTSTTNKFTTAAEKSVWDAKSDFDGAYDSLTGKPTLGTAASADSADFATAAQGALAATAVQPDGDKVLSDNNYTDTEKSKLAGIDESANNYTHPASHAPSIITQDASNRFVTDAEKSTWNAKSDFDGAYASLTGTPTIPSTPGEVGADAAGSAAAVASDLSDHEALTTTAHGGIVASTDSRLTDARTPVTHSHTTTDLPMADSTDGETGTSTTLIPPVSVTKSMIEYNRPQIVNGQFPYLPVKPTLNLNMIDYVNDSNGYPAIMNFSRNSIATYFDAAGNLQTASAGELRHDFDPATGEYEGVLIEEERTNLFLNSLADGTNLSTQTVTVTDQAYTLSFYGDGSITFSGAYSGTLTGTGDFPDRASVTFTPTAGSLVCTVSGDVKCANCEAGSFETSHIPTNGAPVTRLADVAYVNTADFAYNQSEGSVYCESHCPNSSQYYQNFAYQIYESSTKHIIAGYRAGASNKALDTFNFYVLNLTDQVFDYSFNIDKNSINKSAFALKSDDCAWVVGDNEVLVDTDVDLITAASSVYIGSRDIGGVYCLNGHIRHLAYFPQRLTDDQLKAITREY